MNEIAQLLSENLIQWLLTAWIVLACSLTSLIYLKASQAVRSLQRLKDLHPQAPNHYPKLSVIIPACNEEKTLEQAIPTLLKQSYPNLEIILINDRSTDNTGDLIHRLAAQDDRIVPVQITDLPTGWLGKVHGLHIGSQKATGEWLLFTDADVHFEPHTLQKTIALCLEQRLDHLTIAPDVYSNSFWLDVALAAFTLVFLLNLSGFEKPQSQRFSGVGAFNLVRKSCFDRTAGFSWLRMEVADDIGLGLLMHRAGAKSCLLHGADEIGLVWYPSLSAMVHGLEKNLFGVSAHYRYSSLMTKVGLIWLPNLGWILALLQPVGSGLWGLGIAACSCFLLYNWIGMVKFDHWKLVSLFIPIGQLILSFMLLRSAFYCWQQRGIVWRGTLYPLQELREGQRVKI